MRRFPLISDNEPVITPTKIMALYENEDLITNIHGDYHEKDYSNLVSDDTTFVATPPKNADFSTHVDKSYAEIARDEARRDIKKKRQAYVSTDIQKLPSKEAFQKQLKATLPKTTPRSTSQLSHLTDKMHQEEYILAELPVMYQTPNNASAQKPKKNNYDFLKRSQIYNKQNQNTTKDHQKVQELNLMRFNDTH